MYASWFEISHDLAMSRLQATLSRSYQVMSTRINVTSVKLLNFMQIVLNFRTLIIETQNYSVQI